MVIKKFLFLLIAVILVSGLIITGCNSTTTSTAASGQPLKVGVIASTSGFFASMGEYMTVGAQMAIDKVNASGGVMGRTVEMVVRDDQGDPSVVTQKATELKAAGSVAIVGTFMDGVAAVLNQWGNDNKFLISDSTNTVLAERTTKFSKYVFFHQNISLGISNVFAKEIAKMDNVKSVYYLSGDVVVAHDIYDSFWKTMAKSKPSVTNLGVTWVSSQEMDFSSSINAILSKNPSLIITGCGGPQWPAFIKQAQQFGLFQKCKVVAMYGLDASTSEPLGKDTPEGIYGVISCPFWLDTPEMKAFQSDFSAKVKGTRYVNDLTLNYYNATLGLLEAIKKANSLDTDKIIAAWEKITLNTPVGTVSMNDYDHQLVVPIWWGTTKNVPEYSVVTANNMVKYQQDVYPSKDEINTLRAAK
jgi:branched-chain amino acid transport system substrate-binding protein